MQQFITITTQGQLSIPINIRKALGFDLARKAILRVIDNKVIIEPASDVLYLKGKLKKYSHKGKNLQRTINKEDSVIANYIGEKHKP